VVGASAAGQPAHGPGQAVVGDQEVAGAGGEGEVALGLADVHGDQRVGAGRAGGGHRGQADPAEADDEHGVAGSYAGGAVDRADAGEHRAPEQGGGVERQFLGHRHDGGGRHDDLFGERAEAEGHVVVALRRGGPAGGDAQPRFAAQAEPALPAGRRPVEHDVLPGADDGAGGLVAEHQRERRREGPVDHGQVGVADAGRAYPDPHLARAGRGQVDLLDLRLRADTGDDERPRHRWIALVSWNSASPCAPSSRPTPLRL
jgi:hypothetical protein